MKTNALLLILLLLQIAVYGHPSNGPSLSGQQLAFRENNGQIRDQHGNPRTDIDFVLEAPGMTLYIGDGQLHYQFVKRQEPEQQVFSPAQPPKHFQVGGGMTISRIDVQLAGSDKDAEVVKAAPVNTKYNYYTGGGDGLTGVQAYGKITYKNIYPAIDWVLYTEAGGLKYDFIVHPGGKVSDIRMDYDGVQGMQLQQDGSLLVKGPIGSITEAAPYVYALADKKPVSGKYALEGNSLGYEVGSYEGTLVIDPAVEWATYIGGDDSESAQDVAVDAHGHIYVAGITSSTSGLATTGTHQATISGAPQDAYLAKFDSTGALLWATYYGGRASVSFIESTNGTEVACDPFGNVYLAGFTSADAGIATPGTYQPTKDPNSLFVGFVAKFDEDGVRQWGTYYGATVTPPGFFENITYLNALACDATGNIFIGGYMDSLANTSSEFATAGAHQATGGGGMFEGWIAKLDSSGNRLWGTFLGGEVLDQVHDIVVGDSNQIYISGYSNSPSGIATPGTHIPTYDGQGGFVARFDGDGNRIWSSYVADTWSGSSVALDKFGHLYLVMSPQHSTADTTVYTPGAHQTTLFNFSQYNGALIKYDASNGERIWGTYYGAENPTFINGVGTDAAGNVFIAGFTNATAAITTETIATEGSHQDTLNTTPGTSWPEDDGFVVKFDSSGVRKWATYYGGPAYERIYSITGTPSGAVYVVGETGSSSAIATPGSHQPTLTGTSSGFLVRFLPVDIAMSLSAPEQDTVCMGAVPFTVAVKNQGRMDKDDTLKIGYTFNGPSTGGLDTFFTGGLDAGVEENFELGALDLAFPGVYDITIYLHYTRDDEERNNDTIHLSVTTTNAEPVAEIAVSQVGTTYHFSNPSGQPSDTYHWDFGDGNTSDEANPSHSYSATDSYLVTLVITGFCGSDTATMLMEGIGDGSGISDPALAAKLSVYPNPAQEVLFIKTEAGLHAEAYRIVNVLGQELRSGTLEQSAQLDIRNLSAGSYFLHIRTDKGMVSKPFQVLKK